MAQLLQVQFPKLKINDKPPFEFMVADYTKFIRKVFKKGGFLKKVDEKESAGEYLVGYKGHLFHINSDFAVIESVGLFSAAGSGESYALGAMHVMSGLSLSPTERLRRAKEAAAWFDAYVRAPFTILEMKRS